MPRIEPRFFDSPASSLSFGLSRSLHQLPLLHCSATISPPLYGWWLSETRRKVVGRVKGLWPSPVKRNVPECSHCSECVIQTPTSLPHVDKTLFRKRTSVLERVTWRNWLCGISCVYSVFRCCCCCMFIDDTHYSGFMGRLKCVASRLLLHGNCYHTAAGASVCLLSHTQMLNISWILEDITQKTTICTFVSEELVASMFKAEMKKIYIYIK
jgi:hypothetical protein